ncbi:MAG: cyclic nucleotide-binding domain-containing protein [Vicinamibacteria bacterium]
MVLDWLGGNRDRADVSELIARKKYSRAIEVLRGQFAERPPNVQTRLQFVDLLVLAGRSREAVPVLVALAEELARDGFHTKAVAILKRADKIEPGMPHIEGMLAELVHRQYRVLKDVAIPVRAAAAAGEPLFGMEEIQDGEPALEAAAPEAAAPEPAGREPSPPEPAAPEQAAAPPALDDAAFVWPEAVTGKRRGPRRRAPPRHGRPEETTQAAEAAQQAEPEPAPAAGREAPAPHPSLDVDVPSEAGAAEAPAATAAEAEARPEAEPEVEPEIEPEAETARVESQPSESEAAGGEAAPVAEPVPALEPAPARGVTSRIRGAFKRFLSSLPVAGGEPEAAPPHEPTPVVEAEGAGPGEPRAETEPEITVESEVAVEPEIIAEPEPSKEPEAAGREPEIEPEPEVAAGGEPEISVEPEPLVVAESAEPEPARERPVSDPLAELEAPAPGEDLSREAFQEKMLDLLEEVLHQPLPAAAPSPGPAQVGALADEAPVRDGAPVRTRGVLESAQQFASHPLLKDLSEEELLAVVRGMRLRMFEPGDVVITEGEPGDSIFVVSSGSVRVFVRNPTGHNFEMGRLGENEFFGEIGSLSGRPRTATVVAAAPVEMLELDKRTIDRIARSHPRVRQLLEDRYIQRASSPEAAAIRTVRIDPSSRQRAIEVLEAYFGESRWEPRMRLRFADLLVKSGKDEEAVPLLVGLADELAKAGYPEKAIAILKKIEAIRKRNVEEVNLAPLKMKGAKPGVGKAKKGRAAPKPAAPGEGTLPPRGELTLPPRGKPGHTAAFFDNWIVDVVRDVVAPKDQAPELLAPANVGPGYVGGLRASPLFAGFAEEELFELIREFRLLCFDAGDVVVTEGEPGQSLFILTAGSVKVSVRNAAGRNVRLAELGAGAFFGEMAAVSGKPRTATVTAKEPCELLELDKPALDALCERHARIREILEEYYVARATSPDASGARSGPSR